MILFKGLHVQWIIQMISTNDEAWAGLSWRMYSGNLGRKNWHWMLKPPIHCFREDAWFSGSLAIVCQNPAENSSSFVLFLAVKIDERSFSKGIYVAEKVPKAPNLEINARKSPWTWACGACMCEDHIFTYMDLQLATQCGCTETLQRRVWIFCPYSHSMSHCKSSIPRSLEKLVLFACRCLQFIEFIKDRSFCF